MSFPGYNLRQKLHENESTVVFRAIREADQRALILKALRDEFPSVDKLTRFRQEYQVTQKLRGLEGVIQTEALEIQGKRLVIVMEDFNAMSLADWMKGRVVSIGEALEIAIHLTEALSEIHAHDVIHKDINPSNIVLTWADFRLKIIDFGISSWIPKENVGLGNPERLEGTLAYISPEQTGRMNRSVDYRADFYSLGVTLYELLTGVLPFEEKDPLELVHCHLTRQPTQPATLRPAIPKVLSDLVLKLMAKTVERRYQSASGIRQDLQECRQRFEQKGVVADFPLGQGDRTHKLQIPQKLYGRADGLETLLAAFEKTCQGRKQMILVSGHSGIGKTSLVQEIYKPLTRRKGYYVASKYDQFQRINPYLAIATAFKQLLRLILTEDESRLATWRKKVTDVLGQAGQVLVEVIPEIELLVGPQPKFEDLSGMEKQNRFNVLFPRFVQIFAQPECPLVVFIDDLQWADPASLHLIELLMKSEQIQHFQLIGAYRDNEVSEKHPLLLIIAEMEKAAVPITRIQLGPLSLTDINEMIAEALSEEPDKTLSLAEVVLGKTRGNPLFVNEFLFCLHSDGSLSADPSTGEWQWDLTRIQAKEVSDSVLGLIMGSIQRLSPRAQRAIKLASCIGNRFTLSTLTMAQDGEDRQTIQDLQDAVVAGLLFPLSGEYKPLLLGAVESTEARVEYKFSHDRIQQAAYQLLDERARLEIHRKIGRALLEAQSRAGTDENLFDITSHLNLALPLLESQEERTELAELNLTAGKKAKEGAAFNAAYGYLTMGLDLLGGHDWKARYELAFALHEEAVEAACLAGEFARMSQLIDEIEAHARTLVEKVKSYEVKIGAFCMQNDVQSATRTGVQMLRRLGVKFPRFPTKLHALLALGKITISLLWRDISTLSRQPDMSDPRLLAAMRILSAILSPSYFSDPNLLPLIIFKMTALSLKHGAAPNTPQAYATFGAIISDIFRSPKRGHEFYHATVDLADRLPDRACRCQTYYIANCFLRHWHDRIQDTLKPLLQAYQLGLDCGDFEWGAYSAHVYCQHLFWMGQDLRFFAKEAAQYFGVIKEMKNEVALGLQAGFWQGSLNLMGRADDPLIIEGEILPGEEEAVSRCERAKNYTMMIAVLLPKLIICTLLERHDLGRIAARRILRRIDSTVSLFAKVRIHFYRALTLLRSLDTVPWWQRAADWLHILASLEKLTSSAGAAPENHLHLALLLRAELCRHLGRPVRAAKLYEQAIDRANEFGFYAEAALASELAAKFYLAHSQPRIAKLFMQEARYGYQRWGATVKVEHLEKNHKELLTERVHPSGVSVTSSFSTEGTSSGTATSSTNLDVLSVTRVTRAISEEIALERLLEKILGTVAMTAGADRGFLILKDQTGLTVQAAMGNALVPSRPTLPCEAAGFSDLSLSIVRFVERTGESVILGDASSEGSFVHDPFIVHHRPRSVLCIPIIKGARLVGIVYMEHSQVTDAFTPDRVELLKVLLAQAAISIENARLYGELVDSKRQVEQSLEKAKESEKIKSEFFAKTTHELRTPLNAIINVPDVLASSFIPRPVVLCTACSSMMELEEAESLSGSTRCPACNQPTLVETESALFIGTRERLTRQLEIVRKAGKTLLYIVNDILDLSKIQAGKMTLCLSEVKLQSLVGEVTELLEVLSRDQKITLDMRHVAEDAVLLADRGKLRQILVNLVSNSIKFSPSGGAVEIGARPEKDDILMWVRDHGIGIAEQDHELIFESFRQVDGTSTRSFGGTGLGLAIAKQLVELHQGQIWVESKLDQGATFYLRFPRCAAAEACQGPEGKV